jgi:hypothetical protein
MASNAASWLLAYEARPIRLERHVLYLDRCWCLASKAQSMLFRTPCILLFLRLVVPLLEEV